LDTAVAEAAKSEPGFAKYLSDRRCELLGESKVVVIERNIRIDSVDATCTRIYKSHQKNSGAYWAKEKNLSLIFWTFSYLINTFLSTVAKLIL
jgi:hypothetical protein